jgi:hypothetical protein
MNSREDTLASALPADKAVDWVAPQLFLRKLIDTCATRQVFWLEAHSKTFPQFLQWYSFECFSNPCDNQDIRLPLTATGIAPVLHRTSLLILAC